MKTAMKVRPRETDTHKNINTSENEPNRSENTNNNTIDDDL